MPGVPGRGEASRLKLIHALRSGELSVAGLVAETGLAQANASRHLQVLIGAGIAEEVRVAERYEAFAAGSK